MDSEIVYDAVSSHEYTATVYGKKITITSMYEGEWLYVIEPSDDPDCISGVALNSFAEAAAAVECVMERFSPDRALDGEAVVKIPSCSAIQWLEIPEDCYPQDPHSELVELYQARFLGLSMRVMKLRGEDSYDCLIRTADNDYLDLDCARADDIQAAMAICYEEAKAYRIEQLVEMDALIIDYTTPDTDFEDEPELEDE